MHIHLFIAFLTLQRVLSLPERPCPPAPLAALTSTHTDLPLLESLQELAAKCPVSRVSVLSPKDLASLQLPATDIVLDLSGGPLLYESVLDLQNELVISEKGKTQSLYSPWVEELIALFALAKVREVSRLCLFLPANAHFHQKLIETSPELEVSVELVGEGVRPEVVVRRKVQTYGFTAFLLLLAEAETEAVLQALNKEAFRDKKIDVFASTRSANCFFEARKLEWGVKRLLFLLPSGCQDSDSRSDLLLCRITRVITGESHSDFAVMHLISHTFPIYIGRVGQGVVTLSVPVADQNDPKTVYQEVGYSFNNDVKPSAGEGLETSQLIYFGVDLAQANIAKTRDLLPYHSLKQANLSLGYREFNETWANLQLANTSRKDLGVGMLAGAHSAISMRVYSLLALWGLEIPQIGASNTAIALSSKAVYPLYTRVVMSDAYLSVLYGKMISRFGWSHIALVYSNNTYGSGLYSLLLKETASLKITILNSEDYRAIPENPSEVVLKQAASALVACKARVLILIMNETDLFRCIAALYDLGMRRGDVVFLAIEWLTADIFVLKDAEMRRKTMELCIGAVQFYPVSNIGSIGQAFLSQYEAKYSQEPPFYACFYYDAAYLLAYALDYALSAGLNYSQPSVFSSILRSTKFRGCSGVVTIAEGGNDRSPMMYSISNSQLDGKGSVRIVTVGTFNPAGLVLFNFTSEIMWPDGTTDIPSDLRISEIDCPFEISDVVNVYPAAVIMISAVSGVVGVAILLSLLVWKCCWGQSTTVQTSRAEISFDDYCLYATIGIKAGIYSAMGARKPAWADLATLLSLFFSIDFSQVLTLQRGVYWFALSVTCGLVVLWTCLLALLRFRVCRRLHCCEKRLASLGELFFPLIGDLSFVPICSLFLSVFHCTQAVGSAEISQTFLQEDCYQRCWRSTHVGFVVFGVVLMEGYVALAVAFMPAWQNMKASLHIFAYPVYYLMAAVYQLLIIAVNSIAPSVPQPAHSVLFLLLTAVFFLGTLVKRPYGYSRANLWHSVSLLCVFWLELLALISAYVSGLPSLVWAGSWLLGVLLVCAAALLVQWLWLPALLYSKPGIRVVDLFRFMFSRGRALLYLFNRPSREEELAYEHQVMPVTVST